MLMDTVLVDTSAPLPAAAMIPVDSQANPCPTSEPSQGNYYTVTSSPVSASAPVAMARSTPLAVCLPLLVLALWVEVPDCRLLQH